MSDLASNNPKATVTAIATGLEGLSFLIKDETIKRACIILSPGIALTLTFFYRIAKTRINYKRGISEYKKIIADCEDELNNSHISDDRKKSIRSEIEKCRDKINEIRAKSINTIAN